MFIRLNGCEEQQKPQRHFRVLKDAHRHQSAAKLLFGGCIFIFFVTNRQVTGKICASALTADRLLSVDAKH